MCLRNRLAVALIGLATLASGWALLNYRPFAPTPVAGSELVSRGSELGRAAKNVHHVVRPEPARPIGATPAEAITPPLTETTNILLAGLDARGDQWTGARTDSLTMLIVDSRSHHMGLVSIPRDLEVEPAGYGRQRINSVYAAGARRGGGAQAGDALLREVVTQTLGLPVTSSVYVNHAGFEALIEGLDGINVLVRCPIRDRFLDPRGVDGHLELHLEAGVQRLDGRTALMYARSRHGRGIFDRAARQQAVLIGLRDRLLELGPAYIVKALPRLRQVVQTDLRTLDMIRLASRLLSSGGGQLHGLVLSPKHAEITIREDGRWVMVPKPEEIRKALRDLFKAPPAGQRDFRACPDMDVALKPRPARPIASSPRLNHANQSP